MGDNSAKKGWRRSALVLATTCAALGFSSMLWVAASHEYESGIKWKEPRVISPGPVGGHPSDAVVLFDGKDLSQWKGGQDWEIRDGYALTRKHDISTKEAFGDCQLHIEWATPEKI